MCITLCDQNHKVPGSSKRLIFFFFLLSCSLLFPYFKLPVTWAAFFSVSTHWFLCVCGDKAHVDWLTDLWRDFSLLSDTSLASIFFSSGFNCLFSGLWNCLPWKRFLFCALLVICRSFPALSSFKNLCKDELEI